MNPWELLESASAPKGGGELRLYQRGNEFSIRVDGVELMNSRVYSSEDAMARLACERVADRPNPRVLVGGLGMGFTLAAALSDLGPQAEVIVSELVPEVVQWNLGPLGDLANHPLRDPRVTVREIDVATVLGAERCAYDAILLDVDNGPTGITRSGNDWLYGQAGLLATSKALRPGGVLAVWSASPDRAFARRLRAAGFAAEEIAVRARGYTRGARHTIWIAQPEA